MASRSDPDEGLRVGEVARATGMTVRALHHYEEIGLLPPARRTTAGYRLYRADQLERLYRISLLRSLGMPLGAIASTLDDDDVSLRTALEGHIGAVEAQLAVQVRLRQNRHPGSHRSRGPVPCHSAPPRSVDLVTPDEGTMEQPWTRPPRSRSNGRACCGWPGGCSPTTSRPTTSFSRPGCACRAPSRRSRTCPPG